MVAPPAVVIIARHGARLDAADKEWHLFSPAPYDPPLTYGGWTQSRALGARIASLLAARERTLEREDSRIERSNDNNSGEASSSSTNRQRRRRHKIIIHSSPFLRCVQTSIAISAGIGQYRGLNDRETDSPSTSKATKTHTRYHVPSQSHSENIGSPTLAAIEDEDEGGDKSMYSPKHKRKSHKVKLRLDAFLGEWLSPDYYEHITPPPGSVLMVAGAKADLLRRADFIDTTDEPSTAVQGHFPGGWGSNWLGHGNQNHNESIEDTSLPDLSSLAVGSNIHHRAASHGNGGSPSLIKPGPHKITSSDRGYVPPVPRYAIAPIDPIPAGYVAHARDACVEVDYQWDSMRAPQDWGTGGEYGEEWSTMHKRFRKGLQSMIAWYRTHPDSTHQTSGHLRTVHPVSEDDDADVDTVLILVTHGAGCNALIGALTNQPVLIDVGMASLTMAVRKEVTTSSPTSAFPYGDGPIRRNSIDYTLANDYDIRLTASTEHLRAGASPLTVPQLQTPSQRNSPHISAYRSRFGSTSNGDSAIPHGFNLPDSGNQLNRSASAATTRSRRSPSGGLWSHPGSNLSSAVPSNVPSKNPSVSDSSVKSTGKEENDKPLSGLGIVTSANDGAEDDFISPLPAVVHRPSMSTGKGLWGMPNVGEEGDIERSSAPKRRWTVTDSSGETVRPDTLG